MPSGGQTCLDTWQEIPVVTFLLPTVTDTVLATPVWTWHSVWYEVGVFWATVPHVKSLAKALNFWLRTDMNLNEVLYDLVRQEALKILKVNTLTDVKSTTTN